MSSSVKKHWEERCRNCDYYSTKESTFGMCLFHDRKAKPHATCSHFIENGIRPFPYWVTPDLLLGGHEP